MKRLLITLLTITLTASKGISQSSNDTICLPANQLKTAINKIEQCKVVAEELTLTKQTLESANNRLALKDSIISKFELKIKSYDQLFDNQRRLKENLENVVSNLKKEVSLQTRAYKRQKRSKWITAIIGLAVGYLIAK